MASSGPTGGLPPGKVQSIYRYPVKGLSPEPLQRAALDVGSTLLGDRLYAIENGPSGFDPQAPRYRAKIHYLMLMKNERLATLRSRYDDASSTLVITRDARPCAAISKRPMAAWRSSNSSPLSQRPT